MASSLDIIVEIVTFGLVVAASLIGLRRLEAAIDVRRRLSQQAEGPRQDAPSATLIKRQGVRNPLLRWIESSSSLNDSRDRQKLRRDLAMAGFEHPAAPVWYVVGRFAIAIGLPLLFLLGQRLLAKPMTGFGLVFVALGLCGLGLILPRAFIDNRGNSHKEALESEFPDALDLMVVCVEAGLGMEAAFIRVGTETMESHPLIAAEFNKVSDELRAGRTRTDALRAMADRVSVDAIRSFVALLIQTDSLGTSIGQTLRSYANEMRQMRFMKAEEKAMRIPVLMTVPLVACILPVIMVALLLPPILDVMRTLVPAMTHQHH